MCNDTKCNCTIGNIENPNELLDDYYINIALNYDTANSDGNSFSVLQNLCTLCNEMEWCWNENSKDPLDDNYINNALNSDIANSDFLNIKLN